MTSTTRVFTGLKPTGRLHIGNYLGAIVPVLALADDPGNEVRVCVVDLHALTVEHDPRLLRDYTLEMATTLLACGLDSTATLFVQSAVAAHAELSYLLESTATYGEMRRMIAFKDRDRSVSTRLSLLTYPALMAADILVHRADVVPVGDDQRQHLELAVTLARRFNARYGGGMFTVPTGVSPGVAARVMDLRDPTSKMGKSGADPAGVLHLLDEPEVLAAKVRRAVTDADPVLAYDDPDRPGVGNLAALLGALTGQPPERAVLGVHGGAALKAEVAAAVIETLAPIRERYRDLVTNGDEVGRRLKDGAAVVTGDAELTLDAARTAIGLLPRAPGNATSPISLA